MASAGRIEPKGEGADCSRLAELLDRQETLFVRLDALSRRQSQLIRDEETDDLLRVLSERQGVVDALDEASRGIEPFRARWEAVLSASRPDQRDRFRRQVERLAELAAEIAARDEGDRQEIERRRDRMADDLAGVGRVRGAVAAYGPSRARPAAKFQDQEG